MSISKQFEMPILGSIRPNSEPISDLPSGLITLCTDWREAVKLCMRSATVIMSQGEWADYLDMKEGSLSLILNPPRDSTRKRNLDPGLFYQIELKAGNRAISQFFDMQSRGLLRHQSNKARIEELEAELEKLRGLA